MILLPSLNGILLGSFEDAPETLSVEELTVGSFSGFFFWGGGILEGSLDSVGFFFRILSKDSDDGIGFYFIYLFQNILWMICR